MFQKQLLYSNSLFLRRHKPKMSFGQTTPGDSDRKCKFQRFCPARSDCNNVAHGILSFYKLQGVFSQFTDKIWKLQYERILKMQALIGLKKHISVQFIHQRGHKYLQLPSTNLLKTTQIHVFAQLRSCQRSFA